MVFQATKEQQAVLNAELVPLKVIACAGSGKTATAVRRLVELRRRMGTSRGYAVLLSYSNVAVETFRKEYAEVAATYGELSDRVLICTVDSFITNNILAPHAAQVMNCSCRPFLVHGRERFLENPSFSVFDGKRPVSISDVDLRSTKPGKWEFVNADSGQPLPNNNAIKAMKALGKIGAYPPMRCQLLGIRAHEPQAPPLTRHPRTRCSRPRSLPTCPYEHGFLERARTDHSFLPFASSLSGSH